MHVKDYFSFVLSDILKLNCMGLPTGGKVK